jgi:two-component system nitrogen regulation sensor histidine kinase NtrY
MATTSSPDAAEARPMAIPARETAGRVRLGRGLTVVLALMVLAAGIATYVVLSNNGPLGGLLPRRIMAIVDLVLILVLGVLVGWRVIQVWAERRSGAAGSRLRVRLVVMFSLVAVTPAIVVAILSALLIQFWLVGLVGEPARTAIEEARAVAKAYKQEHEESIRGDALAMANDIGRQGLGVLASPMLLERIVANQAELRALSEAIAFDSAGQILARAGLLAYSLEASIPQIPPWALAQARSGEVVVLSSPDNDRVRALVLLQAGLDRDLFLYVGRFADPRVLRQVERAEAASSEYNQSQGSASTVAVTFTVIYVIVAGLLLLGAIWAGLTLANRLATPIVGLIDAAERVRAGDFSARVEARDEATGDEVDNLSRAFNRMTSQLATQRAELVETNRELDERRRFSEAVLAGVTAGVIGLDRDGRVELPNRSAAELLSLSPNVMVGRELAEVVPEMAGLMDTVRRRADHFVEDEIRVMREGRARVLLVRIVGEPGEHEASGYVVTFDDISDLLVAQRQAAWADVARRIAHEIKNPLTPIQLSAERLKRKYLSQITTDRETFVSCTDTIVRQVGDIGRMVDEFSSFARMPAPVMREEDMSDVARQALFLARTGYPGIAFDTELPSRPVRVMCDARQVGQAFTNIIKNAVEAIEGREGADLAPGRIEVRLVENGNAVTLSVRDNGKGLPSAVDRERLTEPYVTTRAKGTGLGLAIVKKIMEDHGGDLVLADLDGAGTMVSLVFHRREAPGDATRIEMGDTVKIDGA